MSKVLAELLGVSEPLLSVGIKQLETASGNPSVDVRLIAEMIGKIHIHKRALGLDPEDTTGEELYYAITSLCGLHDRFLARRIGVTPDLDVNEIIDLLIKFIGNIHIPKSAWVMKHSSAKRLLKTSPPKKVMKQLRYRSIDSLLKRESIEEIFLAIRIFESVEWQQSFALKYKKLHPSDFEMREIAILDMSSEKWGGRLAEYAGIHRSHITHVKEVGAIAVLPIPVDRLDGIVITTLTLVLYYIGEIRAYSSYFKYSQVNPEFGAIFYNCIANDSVKHVHLAGQPIHWRVVHRHFGSDQSIPHPEVFEPHVLPEDLFWRKAEAILFKIEPALQFWNDMDYVGLVSQDQVVSFNLMDAAINYFNRLPFEHHISSHMRESLWNELYGRYLGQDALRNRVLRQLDDDSYSMGIRAAIIR